MKRHLAVLLAGAVALSALAATAAATVAGRQETIKITMWHGQVDVADKTMQKLIATYRKTHPNVEIEATQGAPADQMVQKLKAGLEGGVYPDIVYIFGSDIPLVATAKQVVDLKSQIKKTGFPWNDLFPAGRQTSTAGSKVVGFPAVIDNLAVVYNRKLFRAKKVPFPKGSWTWEQFRATAKKLTDPAKGQYGTAWPGAGEEDTVWRFWPMLWQQGAEILSPDLKRATFNGAAGVKALTLLQQMARTDKSLYVDPAPDTSKMYGLLKSGRLAMVATGPWELPELNDKNVKLDYGVTLMPSYNGSHETISGPDVWTVLDHGDKARLQATVDFLAWLHLPPQDLAWTAGAGSLPTNSKTSKLPGYAKLEKLLPGIGFFAANLANAKHIRPPVPEYTPMSKAIGKAISSVLIGVGEPKSELDKAAAKTNALLK